MMPFLKRLPLAALVLATTVSVRSQDAPQPPANLLGDWLGALETPASKMRVALHITRADDGSLRTTFDSLDQNAMGLAASAVRWQAGEFAAEWADMRAQFVCPFDADTKTLDGTWTQGGSKFPMTLSRGAAEAPKRPQTPKAPFPYRVEEVRFTHEPADEKVTIAGTLTLPGGDGPHPAAVLISGSGPQDRNETLSGHEPFWVLADFLSRNGFAVLRCDDRGVGESTGNFAKATTFDFADDIAAAVRFLKARTDIDRSSIGLIGHSEGGLIAPIVATQCAPEDVAFAVLLAGPGVDGGEIILRQVKTLLTAQQAPKASIERDLATQRELFEILRSTDGEDELKERIDALIEKSWQGLDAASREAVGGREGLASQFAPATQVWFRTFIKHDPAPVLEQLACPVLVLNGTKDVQVAVDQNLPPIREALKRSGNPDVEIRELAGLNHLFQECGTGLPDEYGKIEQTLSPLMLGVMTKWLRERFVRG